MFPLQALTQSLPGPVAPLLPLQSLPGPVDPLLPLQALSHALPCQLMLSDVPFSYVPECVPAMAIITAAPCPGGFPFVVPLLS